MIFILVYTSLSIVHALTSAVGLGTSYNLRSRSSKHQCSLNCVFKLSIDSLVKLLMEQTPPPNQCCLRQSTVQGKSLNCRTVSIQMLMQDTSVMADLHRLRYSALWHQVGQSVKGQCFPLLIWYLPVLLHAGHVEILIPTLHFFFLIPYSMISRASKNFDSIPAMNTCYILCSFFLFFDSFIFSSNFF